MPDHLPTDIKLHQTSRVLEIAFENGQVFELSCEYLRVHSPSAEVRGHSPEQAVLQIDKEEVNILEIEPMGSCWPSSNALCLPRWHTARSFPDSTRDRRLLTRFREWVTASFPPELENP